jgi:hypothetical protein
MTSTSWGMSAASFPPESLPGLPLPEGGPDVMNFFHHGTVPEPMLDRVWVVRTGHFKNLLKVVFRRSHASLEVTFGSYHELLTTVIDFFLDVAIAGHCSQATRLAFLPLLPPLAPFLALLTVVLMGAARPPPTAVSTLTKVKMTMIASLPEACRVAISRNSLVVCDCWWPSS